MQEFFKKWEKQALLEKAARAIVEAIFQDGLLLPIDPVATFWADERRFVISTEYLGDTMFDVAPLSIFRECGTDDDFRRWSFTEEAPERIVEALRRAFFDFQSDFSEMCENE